MKQELLKERFIFILKINMNYKMYYLQKHHIQCLVIEKVDRLTRNYDDYVRVDKWIKGTGDNEVHSVKDSQVLSKRSRSQDILMWDIKVTLAKNTSANLSEEVKKRTT